MPPPREPAQDAEAPGEMPAARNLAAEVALRLGSGAVSLAVARIFGVRDIGPARPAQLARKLATGLAVTAGKKVVLPAVAVVGAALLLRKVTGKRKPEGEEA